MLHSHRSTKQMQILIYLLFLLFDTAARSAQPVSTTRSRHLRSSSLLEGTTTQQDRRSLITLDGSVAACIEVKDGIATNGNSFILGDCANYKYGIDEVNAIDLCSDKEDCRQKLAADDDVLMYQTRRNSNQCMQASHGGIKNGKLKVGSWLRVYPCDPMNPLQHFVRVMGDEIQVKGTNLCVSYRGVNPNVNDDQIQLKKCSDIGEDGWSYD
jgi:hypothetical protein